MAPFAEIVAAGANSARSLLSVGHGRTPEGAIGRTAYSKGGDPALSSHCIAEVLFTTNTMEGGTA